MRIHIVGNAAVWTVTVSRFWAPLDISHLAGTYNVVLDIQNVYMDASRIGDVVQFFTDVTNRNGKLVIVASPKLRELLQCARLNFLEIFDNVSAALQALGEKGQNHEQPRQPQDASSQERRAPQPLAKAAVQEG